MSSYLSLILGKEKWYPLLPNRNARSSPEEWVICNCTFNDSCNRNPTLKHVIKRMRNGFSHGNIECDVPQKIKSMFRHEALKQTIFTIKDKSPESSFWIKISAHDLWNLNCKIFDEINNDELRKLKK